MGTPKGTKPWNAGIGNGWTDKRGYRWQYVIENGKRVASSQSDNIELLLSIIAKRDEQRLTEFNKRVTFYRDRIHCLEWQRRQCPSPVRDFIVHLSTGNWDYTVTSKARELLDILDGKQDTISL